MKRLDEGFRVVEDRLVVESDKGAVVENRLVGFDGFDLIAVFEHRVRYGPALDIGRPGHESCSIPEANRFPIPLRNFLHMLTSDQNLTEKVCRDSGHELHLILVHHKLEISA